MKSSGSLLPDWKKNSVSNVADIFKNSYTPISTIRRENGPTVAEAYVSTWLVAINKIFNMPAENKLSVDQITTLTEIILHEYYYLTEADMKLIYNKIMRSENFARLDLNVMIRAIDDHCSDRHETAESMQIQSQESRQREDVKYIALNVDELKKIGKL